MTFLKGKVILKRKLIGLHYMMHSTVQLRINYIREIKWKVLLNLSSTNGKAYDLKMGIIIKYIKYFLIIVKLIKQIKNSDKNAYLFLFHHRFQADGGVMFPYIDNLSSSNIFRILPHSALEGHSGYIIWLDQPASHPPTRHGNGL